MLLNLAGCDTCDSKKKGTEKHGGCAQILRHFLEVFQGQSRPQEQLVQAASLLVLPMLEAGYEAGEAIVDDDALTTMVTIMFDPPDDLASARPSLVEQLCTVTSLISTLNSWEIVERYMFLPADNVGCCCTREAAKD